MTGTREPTAEDRLRSWARRHPVIAFVVLPTRCHDEWQQLAVGDQVRVVPRGKLRMRDGYAFRVAVVNPPDALVLRQQPPEHPWDATWAFLILPGLPDHCRLLSRSRTAKGSGLAGVAARIGAELMGPVIFMMTRKMLLGIKERAERQAGQAALSGCAYVAH